MSHIFTQPAYPNRICVTVYVVVHVRPYPIVGCMWLHDKRIYFIDYTYEQGYPGRLAGYLAILSGYTVRPRGRPDPRGKSNEVTTPQAEARKFCM